MIGSYRQNLRLKYLSGLRHFEDQFKAWSSILSDEGLSKKEQTGLVKVYLETFDNIKNDKVGSKRGSFLEILYQNIDKINLYDYDVFRLLAQFSIKSYLKIRTTAYEPETFWSDNIRKGIFQHLLRFTIQQNSHNIYGHILFDEVIEGLVNELNLRSLLFDIFKESENSKGITLFWTGAFWKKVYFDLQTLKSDNNNLQLQYASAYRDYLLHVIQWNAEDKKACDNLETITLLYLREIDPVFWFEMMTFMNQSWLLKSGEDEIESMIKSWCQRGCSIGQKGRVHTYVSDIEIDPLHSEYSDNKIQNMMKNTFEMEITKTKEALQVFEPSLKNKVWLKTVQTKAEKLKEMSVFTNNSVEALRLDHLLNNIDFLK